MKNYWYIGDIHGEIGLLNSLLDSILKYNPEQITFIGDYIDRGPYSREVVDRIMGMEVPVACLMGNHELMMLDAFEDSVFGINPMELWYYNGAEATLQSFGFTGFFSFQSQMEDHYLQFFRKLLMSQLSEPVKGFKILASHAGVSPAIPVADQLLLKDYRDLQQYMINRQLGPGDSFLWTREAFFNSSPDLWNNYMIVHGHTPTMKIKQYAQTGNHPQFSFVDNDIAIRRNPDGGEVVSVGIDSGSTLTGRLTGLALFTDNDSHAAHPVHMRSLTVTREDIIPRDLGRVGP
jgi:serine/threonine protein phosphatase 1